MRALRITIMMVLVTLQSAAGAPQDQTGTIRVAVRVAGTLDPIGGAQVTLRRMPSSGGPAASITDANGIAVFSNLSPGPYSITSRSDGYLDRAGAATNIPTIVTIDAQQVNGEVAILMSRAASIGGRVRNAAGSPLANASVEAGTLGYRDGHSTMIFAAIAHTNFNGEYLLSPVVPGIYVIRVTETARKGIMTWYPGNSEMDKATRIGIKPSEDVVGMDIDIPGIPTFKVSGAILNPPVRILPNGQLDSSVPMIGLIRRDVNPPDSNPSPASQNMSRGQNGEFEIELPAGSWDLFPLISNANSANASQFITGRAHVDVVDRDITGVEIPLGSFDLSGRIVRIGTPPRAGDLNLSLRVALLPRASVYAPLVTHLRAAQPLNYDNGFIFASVPPGEYNLQIAGLSPGLYVSDIRFGSKSINEDGIVRVISDASGPVEIQLHDGSASIWGMLEKVDSKNRAVLFAGARVVLVPAPARRENRMLYQSEIVPASGMFSFNSIPPGEYKVFAWKNLPPGGAELNADFIAKYEDQGVPVTVAEGQSVLVQPHLIP